MNTNNSFGDKAPFVALWQSPARACVVGQAFQTYAVRRTFWSLDLVHARRAAKAWAKKHGTEVVWVKHAQYVPKGFR